MKKVIIIFGNITFHHLTPEELKLFKTDNEHRALIHSVEKVTEVEDSDKAINELVDTYGEAWIIPSEFNGEVVYEPDPSRRLSS